MSREIKFKVWDKENKRWVTSLNEKSTTKINYDSRFLVKWNQYELLQYTGLKDKNATEIYEGDIVVNDGYLDWPREVKYHQYCFWFMQINGEAKYPINFEGIQESNIDYKMRWKIIGNIYENPELLKA